MVVGAPDVVLAVAAAAAAAAAVCRLAAAFTQLLLERKLGAKANADVKEPEAANTREANERVAMLGVEAILVAGDRAMEPTRELGCCFGSQRGI